MATLSNIAEQQDRMLAELAELSMELARNLQARALAAEDASEAADLSLAFHRVSRSIRQTLALRSKLERDRKRDDAEDRVQAVRARNARVERRKAQIKLGVERLVWSEADGDEAERLIDDLADRMEMDFLADVFAGDDPIEAHIARLCAELGVDTPETFAARRSDPVDEPARSVTATNPAGEPHADPPDAWRSSG